MITGRTRVFALLGNPVDHSLSPVMHNAAFRALGLDARYFALRCDAESVQPLIRALAAARGGGNVTIPHKRTAAEAITALGGDHLEVCNTFWGEDGGVRGAETDSIGIFESWRAQGAPGGDWLILGTGGSAVAAARAAARAQVGVQVRSRDPARAAEFTRWQAEIGVPAGDLGKIGLVVNCTPLGLHRDDPLPLPVTAIPPGATCLDLVYRPGLTPWVKALRAAGVVAADGREVLLRQGAAAFEAWWPGRQAPLEVMRAALDRALA